MGVSTLPFEQQAAIIFLTIILCMVFSALFAFKMLLKQEIPCCKRRKICNNRYCNRFSSSLNEYLKSDSDDDGDDNSGDEENDKKKAKRTEREIDVLREGVRRDIETERNEMDAKQRQKEADKKLLDELLT